jgi:surfeit locus 1 family protein
MFSNPWLLTTVLVLAAGGVMVRLGIWQLDRLAARRVFNAGAQAQRDAPELDLNTAGPGEDLESMAYRAVQATGEFMFDDEVALRNQVFEGRPAYRLVTPLQLRGREEIVLVDRGFVPADEYTPGDTVTYSSPTGEVAVSGIIRTSQTRPDIGSRSDPTPVPGEELLVWNLINIEQIAGQIPGRFLSIYIQLQAGSAGSGYPVPEAFTPELTEGPHLGYAIQWFTFAAILWVGYPFFVRREGRTQERGSPDDH